MATNLINKTKIDLIGDQLSIKHGPIPWFKGDKTVSINDIQQFYVKELKDKNRKTYNYGVWAVLNDGSRLDLTKGVNMTSDYALVVEQKLEKYLDIKDQRVKGAYGNVKPRINIKEIVIEDTLDLEDLKNKPDPEIDYRENWNNEDLV